MKTGSICAICAAALSLCLCSCSHSGGPKPCDIDENFSGDVTITQNEKTYSAKLSRGAADVWEMEFSKPDTVSGMKLELADGSCTIEFSGLQYRLDRKDLPRYSMASLGCGAMEKLISKSDVSCKSEDGKLLESGVINGQDFTAVFEDDKIKELTVSDQLRFDF